MDEKEQILRIIKKEGEIPTTKIAHILKRNIYHVEDLLEELHGTNLIQKTQKGKYTYWTLSNLKNRSGGSSLTQQNSEPSHF